MLEGKAKLMLVPSFPWGCGFLIIWGGGEGVVGNWLKSTVRGRKGYQKYFLNDL